MGTSKPNRKTELKGKKRSGDRQNRRRSVDYGTSSGSDEQQRNRVEGEGSGQACEATTFFLFDVRAIRPGRQFLAAACYQPMKSYSDNL